MPDRLRTDPSPQPDGTSTAENDGLIEQLLLTGLDHYFAGEHERAISAWTRVLFLDRGHARAKAYIDRARGAIGERQRESDELLHRGVDAFNRGEADTARQLLTSAIERGGPQEVALAFLDRLARLDRSAIAHEPAPSAPARRSRPRADTRPGERRRHAWVLPVLVLALIVLGLLYIQGSRERTAPLLFLLDWRGQGTSGGARLVEDPLPVPRAAEMDLARARVLLASGHARDALRLVDRIRPGDPLQGEAARLREDIQRALLSESGSAGAPRAVAPPPGASVVRDQ
jgi:tetratricopeptide (TPR) repeat protein